MVEGDEEIVARGCSHGAVEAVQGDDFFQKKRRLSFQDLSVYPSAEEGC